MGGSAGKNSLLNDKVINCVAQKHSISAAQVLLRWAIQRNYGKLNFKSICLIKYALCKFVSMNMFHSLS